MARLGIEELRRYAEDVKKASGEIYSLFKGRMEDAARGNTDEAWWESVCEEGMRIAEKYRSTDAREYAAKYVTDCLTELQSLARGEFRKICPLTYHPEPWPAAALAGLLEDPPPDEEIEVRYMTDGGRMARMRVMPD